MHIAYLSALGGGLDTNVRVLAPALVRAGHRVSVLYIHLSGQSTPRIDDIEACRIYQTQVGHFHYYVNRATFGLTSLPRVVRGFEGAVALRRAVQEIKRHEPLDLIELLESFVPSGWLGGVPYVIRLHSADWTWRRMLNEFTGIADALDIRMEQYTLNRASGISSPCIFLADYVRKTCNITKPIEIIPYPIDTTRFTPGESKDNPPMILFVGRVEKRKGADVLMNAIPRVQTACPGAKFVFIGRVCDDVQAQVTTMSAHAQFLGVRPRDELVTWYQRASIFVAPSLWDNSPNTIYEAMACGTPVVATSVGGIPELVDDGATGLLVPSGDAPALADAIIALLGNPARCERIGQRAREKAVAEYGVDRILAQTLALYERAARGLTSAG